MRVRNLAATVVVAQLALAGLASAEMTVSQSNDPTASIQDQFASLLGAEHKTIRALPQARLASLATGPEPVAAAKPAPASAPAAVANPAPELAAAKPAPEAAPPVETEAAAVQPEAEPAAEPFAGFAGMRFPWMKPKASDTPASAALVRYDAAWLASLPAASGDGEWQCLREAVYFESRGETLRGQFAVAEVILNRRDSGRYPRTVCGVVNQAGGGGCQFSFTCDGAPDRMRDPAAIAQAGKIARLMLDGAPRGLTAGATHFHTRAVNPRWANSFPRTAAIGAHLFYRQHGLAN